MKKQKLTIENWEQIGAEVKKAHEEFMRLCNVLAPIPKKVWNKDFEKISKGFSQMKNALDDRAYKEFPEEQERLSDIFY